MTSSIAAFPECWRMICPKTGTELMSKITALLQSKLVPPVLGGIIFYGTTAFMAVKVIRATAPVEGAAHAGPAANLHGPSWDFFNPEMDQLVTELKQERTAMETKALQMNDLSARLKAERAELDDAAKAIKKMQNELDASLTRVKEDEVVNLKKLGKTYAAMEPPGAAKIMRELDDTVIVKILMVMKEAETGPILEALARIGEAETKRAAKISESLRLAVAAKTGAKP